MNHGWEPDVLQLKMTGWRVICAAEACGSHVWMQASMQAVITGLF